MPSNFCCLPYSVFPAWMSTISHCSGFFSLAGEKPNQTKTKTLRPKALNGGKCLFHLTTFRSQSTIEENQDRNYERMAPTGFAHWMTPLALWHGPSLPRNGTEPSHIDHHSRQSFTDMAMGQLKFPLSRFLQLGSIKLTIQKNQNQDTPLSPIAQTHEAKVSCCEWKTSKLST